MRPSFHLSSVLFAVGLSLCLGSSAIAFRTTVREPAFSLPHIYADTTTELAREDGYQTAKDRLGQMILFIRFARGTTFQAFGILSPSLADDDIQVRQEGYSSDEYVKMFNLLPIKFQNALTAYCDGVNDAIDDMFSGALPKPLTLSVVEGLVNKKDIFGNATELTLGEGRDPFYKPPCPGFGCDVTRPSGGYQFTPVLQLAFGTFQIRNFGQTGLDQPALLQELEDLQAALGTTPGQQVWDDLNFIHDPLAPATTPDSTLPGFGGPLSFLGRPFKTMMAWLKSLGGTGLVKTAKLPDFARRDLSDTFRRYQLARAEREARAKKMGGWIKLGSYAWVSDASRSATGNAWLGGFPQMGLQNPSIMHFMELRSPDGIHPGGSINAVGMELAGTAMVVIGHTDEVAWSLTTAPIGNFHHYVEELVNSSGQLTYNDEGTPAAVSSRTEIIPGLPPQQVKLFRTHERIANGKPTGGDRYVVGFKGDFSGRAESGTNTDIVDTGASFTPGALVGGYVAINRGTNAGAMRAISGNTSDTITVASAYGTAIDNTSEYTAVLPGNTMALLTRESSLWLEESTAILGWTRFQEAQSVLDIRAGARFIPATFNMMIADNLAFNGEGTNHGAGGNILYLTAGFVRVRQNGLDRRLPLDGTASPNPFVVTSGVVDSATASTLTDAGAFSQDFSAEPINFTYNNPGVLGSDYIVIITAGNGYRQTRRIASNTGDTLTLEADWGTVPSPGDLYEIQEIMAMPEAMNPAEGYTASWNNKPSAAFDFSTGRNHGVIRILERLSSDTSVTRADNRQWNKDVAGVIGWPRPKVGRYLLPRVRDAFDTLGDCVGPQPSALSALSSLETDNDQPLEGREFDDPVTATARVKTVDYLLDFVDDLAETIYGDDVAGATTVAASHFALDLVVHALDSAAGDVAGSYPQKYTADYFNGADWKLVVRDAFCDFVEVNPFPTDTKPRGEEDFSHLLSALNCFGSGCPLEYPTSPTGNRGTWEQIIEVGPALKGEFIFPLGQSGLITGVFTGASVQNVGIDSHAIDLQPIWSSWRFLPMLNVSQDLATDPDGDLDDDGVLDGYERWYYDNTAQLPTSDTDSDGSDLLSEFLAGTDPTDTDTDDDGLPDGADLAGQGSCPGLAIRKAAIKFRKPSVADDAVVVKGTSADVSINPTAQDTRFVFTSGGDVLIDATLSASDPNWRFSPKVGTPLNFKYVDKDGLQGGITKVSIRRAFKKNELRVVFKAKNLDLVSLVDSADAHLGILFGSGPCTEGEAPNCNLRPGKVLKCKQ